MTDPISDMLTRLRNANQALIPEIKFSHSKMKERIAGIMKQSGYILDYSVEGDKIKSLTVRLKYHGRRGVLAGLQRISKPGLRRYVGSTEIPRVLGGMGTAVISTSRGVMTGVDARKQNLGGELVCYIW